VSGWSAPVDGGDFNPHLNPDILGCLSSLDQMPRKIINIFGGKTTCCGNRKRGRSQSTKEHRGCLLALDRSADLPLDHFSRYEYMLWRQARKIVFTAFQATPDPLALYVFVPSHAKNSIWRRKCLVLDKGITAAKLQVEVTSRVVTDAAEVVVPTETADTIARMLGWSGSVATNLYPFFSGRAR
jgi:hypothetical protein